MRHLNHVIILCLLLTTSAVGQVQQKPEKADESKQELQIYYLKYALASEAAKSIQALLGPSSPAAIMADERLNALLIRGGKATQLDTEKLIEVLDRPEQVSGEPHIKVFQIEQRHTDNALEVVSALGLGVTAATGYDGSLIVRGPEPDLEVIEALLENLERDRHKTNEDVVVEIVWLTEADVPQVAEMDAQILKRLEERGFKKLRTVSVIELTTRMGTPSEAIGAAARGRFRCSLGLNSIGNDTVMELTLDATYEEEKRHDEIQLQSTITTRKNKWIVFGVAPRGGADGNAGSRDLFLVRLKDVEPLE